jgi:shikimate dehydrogenase
MNLYGLIGYPLGHSFSKQYFTEKFEKEGLEDCFFELYPLESIEEFPGLLQNHPSLRGLAVTIPYKETVVPFLSSLTPDAGSIGAVNCIEVLPEGLRGHNTDVVGFEQSFVPQLQHHHTRALVLGTGGASKAVQFVLQKLDIPFLLVSRAREGDNIISYEAVNEKLLNEYTIIINCTPVGMSPKEEEKPPLPYENLNFAHYLYDLVYKPAETRFLLEGKQRGATIKNGYDMLLIQAEENWKIWNEM